MDLENYRSVFKTESDIYDWANFVKVAQSQMSDWVLNTVLSSIRSEYLKLNISAQSRVIFSPFAFQGLFIVTLCIYYSNLNGNRFYFMVY